MRKSFWIKVLLVSVHMIPHIYYVRKKSDKASLRSNGLIREKFQWFMRSTTNVVVCMYNPWMYTAYMNCFSSDRVLMRIGYNRKFQSFQLCNKMVRTYLCLMFIATSIWASASTRKDTFMVNYYNIGTLICNTVVYHMLRDLWVYTTNCVPSNHNTINLFT